MGKDDLFKEISELEAEGIDAMGYFKFVHSKAAQIKAEREWGEIEQLYKEYKEQQESGK